MEKENAKTGDRTTRRLNVLVAIDGSEMADAVVEGAATYCQAGPFDITLLHIIDLVILEDPSMFPMDDDSRLAKYLRTKEAEAKEFLKKKGKKLQEYGIEYKTKIAVGAPADEIIRTAEDEKFDLIMMGTRGLGGLKRLLLGSVAEKVIRRAHCSVTVIR